MTDSSNASRTMLMDLKSLDWSIEILQKLKELGKEIKREFLPEISKNSNNDFGRIISGPL